MQKYHNWLQRVAIFAATGFFVLLGAEKWLTFKWCFAGPFVGETLGWIFANKGWSFKMKLWDSLDDWGRYYQISVLVLIAHQLDWLK